jgi:transposase
MVEFKQKLTTTTSQVYRETLTKLIKAIQKKMRGAVRLHGNARPHTAAPTRALLKHFNWELFDHSPYSPDLAPRDCYLFARTCLKNPVRSQGLHNNDG